MGIGELICFREELKEVKYEMVNKDAEKGGKVHKEEGR